MSARQSMKLGRVIPLWGVIAAGPLAGWRYALIQFVRVQRGQQAQVHIDLRCTAPKWPFPTDVRFNPWRDELKLIAGPRARGFDVEFALKTALESGYAKPPFEDR